MTQAENQNLQQEKTVALSEVNQSAQEESFVDKGLKSMAGFFAKMTGQPDPQTGQAQQAATSNTNQNLEATPQAPQKPGFFQSLFAKTQQFIQKTSDFATTVTTKSHDIAGQVIEKTNAVKDSIVNAPNMVAEKANAVIDKGVDIGAQLKEKIQTGANKLAKDPMGTIKEAGNQTLQVGQNLTNQAFQATSQAVEKVGEEAGNFVKDPLQATQNIWNQAIQATNQAVDKVSREAGEFIQNPLEATQNLGNEVLEKTNATLQKVQSSAHAAENQETSHVWNFLNKIGQGVQNVVEKTKEIWSQAIDTTTDFVKNPVENIDAITGRGAEDQVPVPTETANTTSLDNLTVNAEFVNQASSLPSEEQKSENQAS